MAFLDQLSQSKSPVNESTQVNQATLQISGMRCAGCVQTVEKKLLQNDGVLRATVNLVTQSAVVEYYSSSLDPKALAELLTVTGFESSVQDESKWNVKEPESENLELWPLLFAIALVLFSFLGHIQDVFPIQLPLVGTMTFHFTLATLALIGPGRPILIEGTKSLLRNQPTMDTLVSMGSGISYVMSVIALVFPGLGWDCFFDATVMILGLVLLGRTLEQQAKNKATASFHALLALQSPVAYRFQGGGTQPPKIESIPVKAVVAGDRLQVLRGDHFPVDGWIVDGQTLVDESMLTGESLPSEKAEGNEVMAGTINQHQPVIIEATRTGAETTLAKITRLVEEAQSRKAPIQRLADLIAGYFTYGVMAIAFLTFLFWWGWGIHQWPDVLSETIPMQNMAMSHHPAPSGLLVSIKFAIAVLVIACPCALGLATPTALLVGTSMGAERGLLLRGGEVLERCSQLRSIVFDKTGTLTNGQLEVSDCALAETEHPLLRSNENLIQWVASLEQSSRHPLASAILKHAKELDLLPVESVVTIPGCGVEGAYQHHPIQVGTLQWLIQKGVPISNPDQAQAEQWMRQGKTVIFCAVDQQFAGAIALKDSLRADAKQTLIALGEMGLNTYVLTGDRLENTQVLLQELPLNAEQIESNLSPSQKAQHLQILQKNGPVAMVGDGINDAPALAQADVGIALSSGTDVALETAQIVLTRSQLTGNLIQLSDIVRALRLSRATFQKIKQNLFWAFIYNIIGIPIAAGLLFPMFHLTLSPAAAAALMALSSVSVIGNSLMLQRQWRSIETI